jgi:hypothetical protein
MEYIYANNIFILSLLFVLFSMFYNKKPFLLISIILLFIYIVHIISYNLNNLDKLDIVYSAILIILLFFLVKNMIF